MMTSTNSWRLPLHTSAFPQGPHLTCYKLVLGLLVRDYAIVRQDGTMNAGWKDDENDGNGSILDFVISVSPLYSVYPAFF